MNKIILFLTIILLASPAWAARNVAVPECPYTGHSSCSDGKDNDLDGTVDEAAPSAAFASSGSDYNTEAESCQKVGSWTQTSDSAANAGAYYSNPLGQSYVGGQVACAGSFTNATYYLWVLVRNPGAAKGLWVSTSTITAPSNLTQAAIIPNQANFTWVAVGTTNSAANFLAKVNGTAQRTFSLNGSGALFIMSEPGIQIDCLFLSTNSSAQASCPTGTPPPVPDYVAYTTKASAPGSCSDASWPQANTLAWTGFSSTTDAAPTLQLQWRPSLLYGCITVPDATLFTNETLNDDAGLFQGADDYFEIRIAPDLTRTTNGTWKIGLSPAPGLYVFDASYDAIDKATLSYNAHCTTSRSVSAGVSWSLFFNCDLGFTPANDSLALFQVVVGDAESGSYGYRLGFGHGAFDANDPTKWGIIKYSSTVVPDPPPDTTAPTVTSPTSLNIGTATVDVRATSDEAGTGRARYATSSGGYPSAATCAVSPGTTGCSATTNCPASTCTINLSGLTANTTYYFRFDVKDAAGNVGTSSEVNFTTAASSGKYVAASGGGGTTCSSGSPCTVAYFIANAAAGETWRFKDGTYSPISLNCAAGGNFRNGSSGSPITIIADNERQALIQGTGDEAGAFLVNNCQWLTVSGFHVKGADSNSGIAEGDVMVWNNSSNIIITRNILERPNRYQNAHLLAIVTASNLTITENEGYFAHRHGIAISHVSNSYIARNYMNMRSASFPPLTAVGVGGGSTGFSCYPCNHNVIANNVMEGWINTSLGAGAGFDIQAYHEDTSGNQWLGNVSYDSSYGFLFNARGTESDGSGQPINQSMKNNVVIVRSGALRAFTFRSPRNVNCDNCTAISNATTEAGFYCDIEGGAGGPESGAAPYSCSAQNFLSINATTGYGFYVPAGSGWSGTFDHDNSYNNAIATSFGAGITSTNATTTNPNLGTCKIFIPDGTAMKGAGASGADIGANVLYQYNSNGALTTTKLWDSAGTVQFKGATVTGLNDTAGSSLYDIGNRLNIGQNSCSTPAGY